MSVLADALHQSINERVAPVRGACAGQFVAGADLQGCPVVNPQGEALGEVTAVLLDLRRGRIAAVVMASGGLLGLGQRRFAVPWPALALDGSRNALVLDAQREAFDHAPEFDDERWAEQSAAPAWHDQLERHWGVAP
jgi:sporulation protein YlmC with PRC-barrel domain